MKDNIPVDSVATVSIPLLLVTKDLFTTSLSQKVVSVDCIKKKKKYNFLEARECYRRTVYEGRLRINDP